MIKKSKLDIWLLIYEKFLLAIAVAAITGSLLYIYNVYSKAFEVAETQSRSYSLVGNKLRDLVLDSGIKTVREVRSAYDNSARTLPASSAQTAYALAFELEKTAALISLVLPKSSALAGSIAKKMRESIVDFESGLQFTRPQIEAFESIMSSLQIEFLRTYNSEISNLSILEFRRFKDRFDEEIPIYLRPLSVIAIFLVFLVTSTIWIFRVNSRIAADSFGNRTDRES